MYDQLFPDKTEQAFSARLSRPLETQPTQRFSGWGLFTAAPKGLAAGSAQGIGSTADLLGAFGSVQGAMPGGSGGMFSVQTDTERKQSQEATTKLLTEGPDYRSEAGRSFRNVARDYIPDPMTTHASERVLFDLARVGGKAVTAAMTLGNLPGAVVAGAEEGFTMADDLAEQGVDKETRTKVGAVNAVMNAGAFALPIAGRTWAQTGALAVAGGPLAYVGQNAATRKILEDADYTKLADQYDPFDPLGLTLATVLPLGFGALAMRGRKAAGAAPPADDVVDAARVSLLRENMDVHNPDPSLTGTDTHAQAYGRAMDQMADGERISIGDLVSPQAAEQIAQEMKRRIPALYDTPSRDDVHITRLEGEAQGKMLELYEQAAREKPAFDSTIRGIADEIGGTAKLADIKRSEKAVQKVLSDYQGDPSKIKDLLRATIQVDSVEAANRAVASIFERFEVAKTNRRNLLSQDVSPADGYRDAKFNVIVNGHVAEVQVNIPEMLAAKKNGGHKVYDEIVALRQKATGRVFTKAEQKQMDDLLAKSRAIYEPAWAKALMRESASTNAGSAANSSSEISPRDSATSPANSSGETGPPLRMAESGGNTRGGSVSQAALENGTPGTLPKDTGIPSTSRSSTPLGKVDGTATDFISSSENSIGETTDKGNSAYLERAIGEVESKSPEMLVQLDGMEQPVTVAEAMAMVKRDLDADLADVPLLQAAAECFIQSGGGAV